MAEPKQELVRINERGEAHPVGSVASKRMRRRRGAYRMLPGPDHVVFMRYTGDDGRRDEVDGRVVRLAGEIAAPGAFCDVMGLLAQTGWRGEAAIHDGEGVRSLLFEEGNVVGAETNVAQERLGSVMYRFGLLDEAALERALEQTQTGERLGAACLRLGLLTQDQIYGALRRQSEEIAFSAMTVADGTFYFLEGFEDARLISRQAISANALLMDAVTRMDEIRYFRERIPSGDYVPERIDDGPVNDELRMSFDAIDGRSNIAQIGRYTGRGEFLTTKDVYTLLRAQQVRVQPPRLSEGPAAIVATTNDILRTLHRRVDAVSDEKGRRVREGLASFATGAGLYDVLFLDAGPASDGTFRVNALVQNAGLVASGDEAHVTLRNMLHEYASFALFSVGAVCGAECEAKAVAEVAARVAQLRPRNTPANR